MALFTVNYGSDVMNKYMGMNVILPDEEGIKDKDGKFAVIYLLHGYTDDYTKWLRLTSVERYAREMGYAIVMPDAGKSFYTDMVHGDPYFTYLTEEVPAYVQKWFPITSDPEYTYVAGLSMGGYGAMKMALTYPEKYRAAGTFSGALAMAQFMQTPMAEDAEPWLKRLETDLPLIYGYDTDISGTQHDLFALLMKNKEENKRLPSLYVSCGTEDFLLEGTRAFKHVLEECGYEATYSERTGIHSWEFWDYDVEQFMKMIEKL